MTQGAHAARVLVPMKKPEISESPGAVPQDVVENEPSLTRELERVEEANLRFYEAFTHGDIEKMAEVWSQTPHARCVHPGWELVVGWADIRTSWTEIFRTVQEISFQLQDIHVEVAGRTAWANLVAYVSVTTDEGETFQAAINTTNIFELVDLDWKLLLHHSSNFVEEDDEEESDDQATAGFGLGYSGGGFPKPN